MIANDVSEDARASQVQFKPLTKREKKEAKKREKELKKIAREQQQARDYLARESKFNEVSSQRGWKDWASWCEGIKLAELKEEVGTVSQSVNRLLDRASHTIDVIGTHRSHAEEQYLRNVQNHSELLDYIIKLFRVFQDALSETYENERERMIADFFNEANFRDSILEKRLIEYGNYENAAVSMVKCRLIKSKEKFIEREVDVVARSLIEREESTKKSNYREAVACNEIRRLVELFNKELWPKERLGKYYETLEVTTKDDRAIEEGEKKIKASKEMIAKMKGELIECLQCSRIAELKSEHKFMLRVLEEFKKKVRNEEISDAQRLLRLVSISEEAKRKLKWKLDKLKAIQMTTKLCLKLEKLSDWSFESSTEAFNHPLELLFQKLSAVEAECVLLKKYKKSIIEKNGEIEARIKHEKHQFEVRKNLAMLRLDSSPSVGTICQISHQIHQIKSSVSLQKNFKLCRGCKNHLAC